MIRLAPGADPMGAPVLEVRRLPSANGRATVDATGEIDLATAPQLANVLADVAASGVSEVIVDLSKVDFIDSSGIGVLVRAAREAEHIGGRLYLAGARGMVARVLQVTGVADYLRVPEHLAAEFSDAAHEQPGPDST